MEINNITRCVFMAPDPKLVTVNIAEVEDSAKRRRAEQNAHPKPPEAADLRKEYDVHRKKLFELKQNVHTFETRTNEAAGKINNLEKRINEVLNFKKAASVAGNLIGERTYEHQVQLLEIELQDAKKDFDKNNHWSAQAVRALRTFDGAERIAELKALLDGEVAVKAVSPEPEAPSTTNTKWW